MRQAARKATADPTFIVEFHPDIELNFARGILLALGYELHENPDLGPHRLMFRAAGNDLVLLAARDEVSYIFPASSQLAAGLPTERCESFLGKSTIAQALATLGSGWDGEGLNTATLGFFFSRRTQDLSASVQQDEITRAMKTWASVIALSWNQASSPAEARTVNFLFGDGSHGDPYPFDGPSGVLAHAFYPTSGEPFAGDVHFDDGETWRSGASHDLFSVALHELGHALGLAHSDNPDAVMYPYYRKVEKLDSEDIASILTLYAPASSGSPLSPDAACPVTSSPQRHGPVGRRSTPPCPEQADRP